VKVDDFSFILIEAVHWRPCTEDSGPNRTDAVDFSPTRRDLSIRIVWRWQIFEKMFPVDAAFALRLHFSLTGRRQNPQGVSHSFPIFATKIRIGNSANQRNSLESFLYNFNERNNFLKIAKKL
jgi:hypothetical protein